MTQRCQLMSFRDEFGIPNGQIFFPCADEDSKDDDLDAFICGNNYTEWLEELAEIMDKEIFYRIRGCHFRSVLCNLLEQMCSSLVCSNTREWNFALTLLNWFVDSANPNIFYMRQF
ncbi:uncharacterized protein LOC125373520 [Haliotis rufescens]|uniref:uncharacterized protein LOC125373520 n=1 Tax=Haliotis rufescens TaxID=6454 RepID=UPI00201FB1F2|nr:uncharacterized protein LOC125373520 [Haliotis rufescens]